MIELTEALLSKQWTEVEYTLLKRMIGNLISYKHFIPNVIKNDIVDILTIANKIKSEYDNIINGEGVKDIKDAENQTDTDTDTQIDTQIDININLNKMCQTESYTQIFTIVSRLQLENNSIILNESNIFENKSQPTTTPVTVPVPVVPKKKRRRNIFEKIFFIE
jgi:hypothetical protein